MRELNSIESEHTSGGGIKVKADGTVTHTAGRTTVSSGGGVEIRTNDGWRYSAGSNGVFTVTNSAGRLIDSTMLRWLKAT